MFLTQRSEKKKRIQYFLRQIPHLNFMKYIYIYFFAGNAFIVSSIPIWLYWRIHAVDPASTAIILALVTIASTWLVAFAYRNTKHVLKHKVAVKRESAVSKDMNKEVL